jgi:hypothetical protein
VTVTAFESNRLVSTEARLEWPDARAPHGDLAHSTPSNRSAERQPAVGTHLWTKLCSDA